MGIEFISITFDMILNCSFARIYDLCLQSSVFSLLKSQKNPFSFPCITSAQMMKRAQAFALGTATSIGLVLSLPEDPLNIRSSPFYHTLSDRVAVPLLRAVQDGEQAHRTAVKAAKFGMTPSDPSNDPRLLVSLPARSGDPSHRLVLRNPVGLAAGFDKDAEAVPGLLQAGFGLVEIGSVTPNPQPGNPKPRVFRLPEDRGVINRYGFNSQGHSNARSNLLQLKELTGEAGDPINSPKVMSGVPMYRGAVGVNLGKNKTSPSAIADYTKGIEALGPLGDYIVVNVSSPNTPGLRGLQEKGKLLELLSACVVARDKHCPRSPGKGNLLFVKVAPDLTDAEIEDIADVIKESGVDGVIVSNTTNARPDTLQSENKKEGGGLSGRPLKEKSTECIRKMSSALGGAVPIIGVGGIECGEDAWDKMKAGASAVQLYSSLTYEGLGLVRRIKEDILKKMEEEGIESLAEMKRE